MMAGTALILAVVAGCHKEIACPPGARLMGQPPPDGDEVWCEKLVNGKPLKEGPFVVFDSGAGGKMIEGYYLDGKQDGDWTTYYQNGQRSAVDHFRNGVQDGLHQSWYANGQMAARGYYKNGKREGTWKRWDPDGIRNWEEVYKDGKKIA